MKDYKNLPSAQKRQLFNLTEVGMAALSIALFLSTIAVYLYQF